MQEQGPGVDERVRSRAQVGHGIGWPQTGAETGLDWRKGTKVTQEVGGHVDNLHDSFYFLTEAHRLIAMGAEKLKG